MLDTTLAIRDQIVAAGPSAVVRAIAKLIRAEIRTPDSEEIMAALSAIADRLPGPAVQDESEPLPF